jgi:hypothetical protein
MSQKIRIRHDKKVTQHVKEVHEKVLNLLHPLVENDKLPIYIQLSEFNKLKVRGVTNVRKLPPNPLLDYEGEEGVFLEDPDRVFVKPKNLIYLDDISAHEIGHPVVGEKIYSLITTHNKTPETFGELAGVYNSLWLLVQNAFHDQFKHFAQMYDDQPTVLKMSLDEFYADLCSFECAKTNFSRIDIATHLLKDISPTQKINSELYSMNLKLQLLQNQQYTNKTPPILRKLKHAANYIPSWAAEKLVQDHGSAKAIADAGYLEISPEELWHDVLAPLPLE